MSDYSSLKATINANIKANNNQEITGAIMNSVLNAMVNSLGAGYQFIGVATPTNPGSAQTPDYKCFYLATTPGTYTNLGGLVVADGEVALLKYDTTWTKEVAGAATAEYIFHSSLNKIIKEIYIDQSVVPGYDYFKLNWYVAEGSRIYRITGVTGTTETIITQQAYPLNSYGVFPMYLNDDTTLFGYILVDTRENLESAAYDIRLYRTDLYDNPCIASYLQGNELSLDYNTKISQLNAKFVHTNDAELNAIIKELYIDESVISGFDSFKLNWYKDLNMYRIIAVDGSSETIVDNEAFTPNSYYIRTLTTNTGWPVEGIVYGYMVIDTRNVVSATKYNIPISHHQLYDNPICYARTIEVGLGGKISDVNSQIVHSDSDELNGVLKEIYIDSSTISAFDSISVNWYSSLHLIRIIATKNGVSEILSQEGWTPGKYEIKPLITDGNYHEEGIHYGYIVLDTTKTCPDKSGISISRYELYDNPIIYSYILGVTGPKINYITATRNADNFNSIRGIINAINDATEDNQYVIMVPKGEWFECDLNGKNYVRIVGESRDETILYCDGTSTKRTPADYSISAYQNTPLNEIPEICKHCVMQRANLDFDNLTIRVNDAKYCIHVGASDLGGSYSKLSVTNCNLIALENTFNPVGIGADGYEAYFKNCVFSINNGEEVGIHCHNHSNSLKPIHLNIIDCFFEGCGFINAGELGSGQDDYYNIINCYSSVCGSIYYYVDPGFTWINPTTHEQETNPQNVPYCIKINALGSNVIAIIDRPINGVDSRPNAQKYILTDHYIVLPSTGLSLGDVVRGYLDLKNAIHISANGKVLGVVEKIIDGLAYIAKGRVILRISQLTAGSEGSPAYMDANKKITNVVSGDPIGLFDTTLMWGEYQAVILF